DTEDEYRRLLYVAMTRAADRLIVGGCMPGNMNKVRLHSWYDLIDKGLTQSGLGQETVETPDGPVKRVSRTADGQPAAGTPAPVVRSPPSALPDWLVTPLPGRPPLDNLRRPSEAGGASRSAASGESVLERSRAVQRGSLVHRLLQSLPDIAAIRRRDAA